MLLLMTMMIMVLLVLLVVFLQSLFLLMALAMTVLAVPHDTASLAALHVKLFRPSALLAVEILSHVILKLELRLVLLAIVNASDFIVLLALLLDFPLHSRVVVHRIGVFRIPTRTVHFVGKHLANASVVHKFNFLVFFVLFEHFVFFFDDNRRRGRGNNG